MQALMLAAGMGKRLGRYTQNGTKCMVQINGKALIEYAIEALVKSGVKKFTLVVGYRSDVLKNYIQSKFNEDNLCGMKIDYIENPVYDKTNNIYSKKNLENQWMLSQETCGLLLLVQIRQSFWNFAVNTSRNILKKTKMISLSQKS